MSMRATVLAASLAAVVVVIVGALALRAWFEREPPPLDASGPGTALRLTPSSGAVPPPRFDVNLPGGARTSLAMAGIETGQGRTVGQVSVFPAGAAPQRLDLAEGQSGQAGGLTVMVVHIWQMPDHANDAIDVRVVPATGGA
ncbi:MAG TPA: hypothetical protein VOB72_14380 [Candidatus Dormibacteraeota bacterium]|nr:hypothetical protein [Candidatus Dormibacteraeota bacterium]